MEWLVLRNKLHDASFTGPRYARLASLLRAGISDGSWSTYPFLPPERALAASLGLSRVTIRKALGILTSEGLIQTKRGSGSLLRPAKEGCAPFPHNPSIRANLVDWESVAPGFAEPPEAFELALPPGAPIVRTVRRPQREGVTVGIERAVIPAGAIDLNAHDVALYDAMSVYRPVRALQRIRTMTLSPAQCDELGVPPASAGLVVEKKGYADHGGVVIAVEGIFRADRYEMFFETIEHCRAHPDSGRRLVPGDMPDQGRK